MNIRITGVQNLPDIHPGDDLAALIRAAAPPIGPRAIVVVAQKIVSKAEGALADLAAVEPSPFAREWASKWSRDPRLVELVLRESRRIVKMDRGVIIAETHHGLVAANAGVDESNVPGECATLLPRDPDASARALRGALGAGAVIVSDTFGRPWREGLVNVAIGVAGLAPLEDLRGAPDRYGRRLHVTVLALADELAAAAGLVMRKAAGIPVALIEGYPFAASEEGARALVRPPERDLFR